MADDFLSSLGAGLRGAGAILSPDVWAQQRQDDQMLAKFRMQQQQAQQELLAKAVMAGAMSPEAAQAAGLRTPGLGPGVQEQKFLRENQLAEKVRATMAPFMERGDFKGAINAAITNHPEWMHTGNIQGFKSLLEMNAPAAPDKINPGQGIADPTAPGGYRVPIPAADKPEKTSPVAQLIAERDALPANDPNRRIYDNAIRKASETPAQIVPRVIVNTGEKPLTDIAKLNADYKAGRITKEQFEAASNKRLGTDPAGANSPEDMTFWADRVLAGDNFPQFGYGKQAAAKREELRRAVVSLAKERGITGAESLADKAEYNAGAASLRQLTLRSNAIEQSSKKIDKDIVTLKSYLESGTAGGIRLTNEPINKIREKFSSPELGELIIAAKIVGTEYERMINGGLLSVAQLHEGAREDAHKLINADMTPTEMKARLGVMVQEINNQRSAFKDQIAEVKGGLGRRRSPNTAPATETQGWNADKERRYQELLKKQTNATQ